MIISPLFIFSARLRPSKGQSSLTQEATTSPPFPIRSDDDDPWQASTTPDSCHVSSRIMIWLKAQKGRGRRASHMHKLLDWFPCLIHEIFRRYLNTERPAFCSPKRFCQFDLSFPARHPARRRPSHQKCQKKDQREHEKGGPGRLASLPGSRGAEWRLYVYVASNPGTPVESGSRLVFV